MEEDKKKRKNKKKKNKQATKTTGSVTLDARESTSESQSHVLEIEQNSNGQAPGVVDPSNSVGGHIGVGRGGNHATDSKGTNLAEAEEQYQLGREVSFQENVKELEAEEDAQIQKEKIKQFLKGKAENARMEANEREEVKKLQDEKNVFLQKEALLEERIKQLLKENDENAQKEVSEREKIKQLYDENKASMQDEASQKEKLMKLEKEKDALSHNEGILEQKILQLQKEVEVHLQKEASLEAKILQLEGEKNSWVQKEVDFKDRINLLVDEAAFFNLKGVSLKEKIKEMEKERDSWILKENSAKDSVARLTDENIKLRAQMIELEQSRESLLDENQQLTQTVSSVAFQTNNLESSSGIRHSSVDNTVTCEDGDANYQIEAARALIEKLIVENSELVEKVNELYAELDRRGVRSEQFSFSGSVPGAVTNQSADSSAFVPDLEGVIVEGQQNGELVEIDDGPRVASPSEITEVDEIVQIPLDEIETMKNDLGVPQDAEKTNVLLLSDAPLIGAPFRLMSFVARYVSGADLVNKNAGE